MLSVHLAFGDITSIEMSLRRLDAQLLPFLQNPLHHNAPLRSPLPHKVSRTTHLLQSWWKRGISSMEFFLISPISDVH